MARSKFFEFVEYLIKREQTRNLNHLTLSFRFMVILLAQNDLKKKEITDFTDMYKSRRLAKNKFTQKNPIYIQIMTKPFSKSLLTITQLILSLFFFSYLQ